MQVTINEKKDFIRWFLNTFQVKRRECVWILNYLFSHDALIEKMHFVEEVKDCPRGMLISTHCTDEEPFCFYLEGVKTTDPEKAFHHIRLNRDQDIYIQLNFKNAAKSENYALVLEKNPYSKEEVSDEVSKEADSFLVYCLKKNKLDKIKIEIDNALDLRNEQLFYELTKQLKKINELS